MRGTIHRALATAPEHFRLHLFEEAGLGRHVEAALDRTGRWEQRSCPLSAPLVVAFVLAMVLQRPLSIEALLRRFLDMLCPEGGDSERSGLDVTPEAVIKARGRLGSDPLREVFRSMAEEMAVLPGFRDLKLWGVDGVVWTAPDTPDNERAFGRTASHRGRSAWPQLRAVPLMELTTRRVRDFQLSPCARSERAAVPALLDHLDGDDLVLMDRGFSAAWLFDLFRMRGVHFLARIGSTWKPKYLRRLSDGSWLVEVSGRSYRPGEEPGHGSPTGPKVTLTLRLVEYRVGGRETIRLVTDLLDETVYPAHEVAHLYNLRWECELAYDEQKTHMSAPQKGSAATTFRSKTAEGVRQEAYAMMLAYNLMRDLMVRAALETNINPLRLSFLGVLDRIRVWLPRLHECRRQDLPGRRRQFLRDLARCVLRRSRRNRAYDRVVKRKMSNFPLKRAHHRQKVVDLRSALRVRLRRQPERLAA
jgi:Transposase DDE domain/Insertion element 4 transposase N-terminal